MTSLAPSLPSVQLAGPATGAPKWFPYLHQFVAAVPQYHVAVLYVDGKVFELLEAGIHYFWKFLRELKL